MNRKYLEEPCVWVESNSTTLNILTSHAEIGLGFLLVMSLVSSVSQPFSFYFPFCSYPSYPFSVQVIVYLMQPLFLNHKCRWQRNIIQTFMYWQVGFFALWIHICVCVGAVKCAFVLMHPTKWITEILNCFQQTIFKNLFDLKCLGELIKIPHDMLVPMSCFQIIFISFSRYLL